MRSSKTLINRKLGDYVLLRRLAVGGQSEVFLARKEGPGAFNRPVVIKALPSRYRSDPKFVELFHREAFLSSRFSHPHVITVHDARVLEGEQCMVMDFVSGQTVADIAQRGYQVGDPPSMNQAVRIVSDACDGLDYTHNFRGLDETEYPVVHRDVSPQNLMVTYQGVTLVFDFGIAKIVGEESTLDTLAGGKYAYMSPEQCRGDEVDTRSDIFSLGVILYELTVGRRLFRRASKEEVVEAVAEEPIEPPGSVRSTFPTMLEDIVMKALQREPDRRYQTAGRMRDDLRDFLAVQSGEKARKGLGDYVAGLFEKERAAIARVMRRAEALEEEPKPKEGIPLENLGRQDSGVSDDDPAVEMPEPAHSAEDSESDRQKDADSDRESEVDEATRGEGAQESADGAADATASIEMEIAKPNDDSSDVPAEESDGSCDDSPVREAPPEEVERELEELRSRQSMLFLALGILSLLAIGLSIFTVVQGTESSKQEAVEIGSSGG